jgi:gamma-glutamyltranspeptidase/glutathione hydrolase
MRRRGITRLSAAIAAALMAAALAVALSVGGTAASGADGGGNTAPQPHTVDVGTGGAVATTHPAATRAGIQVLKSGGNAVDAAVATAAVLGLTNPGNTGIGGLNYMTIYLNRHQHAVVIGNRAPSPGAFGQDDREGLSSTGGLSVGVPTALMGWEQALERYGTISLRKALQPAIRVARKGFVVRDAFPRADRFKAFTSSRELYFDDNLEPYPVGSVFRNPDLARTYQLIAKHGVDAFYKGPIARAIVDAIQHPPLAEDAGQYVNEASQRPGVMELSDLSGYRQPGIWKPTSVDYRGYDVYSTPPPESGGSTVSEALNILEGFDLSGPDRPLAVHRAIEASKLAFADRARYVGDPDFFDVPLEELLSQGYADERRCLIGDRAMQAPVAAGDPNPPYDTICSSSGSGQVEHEHVGSTDHFSVVDRWGNTVSYNGTNVSNNGVVVPGYGFFLNNEMTNFNPQPLFEGDPNLAAGNKRPRGNMAPTVVVRDGRPVLSVGAAGGQTIQTTVLGILVNHLDFGMGLPEALSAGRASQTNTATTLAEAPFLGTYGDELTARFGQRFSGSGGIAVAQGVSILPDGRFVAVSDARAGAGDARVVRSEEDDEDRDM